MDKIGQRLFVVALHLVAALVATGILLAFSEQSWLASAGWMLFFLALQSPFFLGSQASQQNCTAWLSRLRRRS